MPSTTSTDPTRAAQRAGLGAARPRASYPRLPEILDEDSLAEVATLESRERDFALSGGTERLRYLRALYLKAVSFLGHAHFQPRDLPRQMRRSVAEQLGIDAAVVRLGAVDSGEKSRIVADARAFLGLAPVTRKNLADVGAWLERELARKEDDLTVLMRAVVEDLRARRIEIPRPAVVQAIAERAVRHVVSTSLDIVADALDAEDTRRLEALLLEQSGTFDATKDAILPATTVNLAHTLARLELLSSYVPKGHLPATISRRQMEQLAAEARRYTAFELQQLRRPRRLALLACFVTHAGSDLLDALADMMLRVWDYTKQDATNHANAREYAMRTAHEESKGTLEDIVEIILRCDTQAALWSSVYAYRSRAEYDALHSKLKSTKGYQATYLDKIEDHYGSLRRFLPDWYRLLPLCSTTTNDAIPEAHAFAREHAGPDSTELPVENCPTEFLAPPWESRAIRRYSRTDEIVRVHKVPYELGLIEATTQALKDGTVAITGARRYAPILDHLLPREEFLAHYDEHVAKLGHPKTAAEHYGPLRDKLGEDLANFDKHYRSQEKTFWVNSDGTLGFSRIPGQPTAGRVTRVRDALAPYVPEVSIIDLLLDCHRLTGFLDAFQPTSGRQNMPEDERLRYALAALYAYGCNCGPGQAARALGLQKSQVVYMRRRYMATPRLMAAASTLTHAYQQTPVAERLGDINVLMTDSMQVRTLRESLIARQHHRYLSGKSTLLYQHVAASCICLFTQALLCNVSEAIHMLAGVLACRDGSDAIINICDSAGKSDLVFGLSGLLNILLYPRVRSRNLMLWGIDKNASYKNIGHAITGQIRWDLIDAGWQDMMWVLASIASGAGKPAVIFERLAAQPQHPATRGFQELGKLGRSSYLLRYGTDMDLRNFVVPHTAKREHWNKFTREVMAFGDLVREKTLEDQTEVFWFLTVVQNAIVLWNALAIEDAVRKAMAAGVKIDEGVLPHVHPTLTGQINFVGMFNLDFARQPPFTFRGLMDLASAASLRKQA